MAVVPSSVSAAAVSLWAAGSLLLAACGSKEAEPPEAPPAASPATEPSAEPGEADGDDGAEPVVLDRSQDYKAEQLRLAMRGITYEGGVLAIDPAVAPSIAAHPDAGASAAALAEGHALIAANRRDEAVAAMTRAVLLAPESAPAYEGLGDALTVRRKIPEAAAAFRAGLELDPGSASLHFKLGDGLVRLEQREEAIALLRRALELEPAHAQARERLALQLYYTGRPAEAWAEVHAAEALGQAVPPQFRALLARALPEPAFQAEEE
jgi:tetratricopeptide (TPR) repeat protein